MTGRHDVRKVNIDSSLLSEDKDVLEDLVAAAMNDAVRRAEKNQQDKMSELTAGDTSSTWIQVAVLLGTFKALVEDHQTRSAKTKHQNQAPRTKHQNQAQILDTDERTNITRTGY